MPESSATARELLKLISTALSTIEKTCEANNCEIPDLHLPFQPTSESFRSYPAAAEAANVISAAAFQLAAIFMPPQVSLYQVVGGHKKSAALRVCLESNVTEILREGGPEGVHIDDIGAKNGQDPQKIGRFLRILASNHIYREIKPNVFTNTRISSMLDTGKSSEEVLANPKKKHDNTLGLAALASHHLDEAFKASAYAWETLVDPMTAKSGEPDASPFARAMGRKETLWQFYERPEEAFRHRRFGIGMQGVKAFQPAAVSLDAFDWEGLPSGAVVVDVGGGVGTSSLPLAKTFPGLQFIVQDLPGVIQEAEKLWVEELPGAVESGRIKIEVQNFFEPQPQRNVSVFFMKQILHDWSDQYCTKILKNLWAAASKETRLVLMESLMPFACHDPSADEGGRFGAVSQGHMAPAPLLANYGAVKEMAYGADIVMFLLFNSQERTIRHIDDLLRRTGWQMTVVRRQKGSDSTFLQSMEAAPIGK